MERVDAQTIIAVLMADDDLRREVLEALESDELRRLQEQTQRINRRVQELEMRQAYLEQAVRELQAKYEETQRRVQVAEALIRRLLQQKQSGATDTPLGFLVVRKPSTDTTLN